MSTETKVTKKKRSGYKHVNEDDFKNVKLMLSAGLSVSQISRVTKRGKETVSLICKSESFAEYRKLMAERGAMYRGGKNKTTAPTQQTQLVLDEDALKLLLNIAEEINKIKESVDFLATHIEVPPSRKFFKVGRP